MAVAALAALALDQALKGVRADSPGMARRFQKTLAKVFAGPWVLATSEDMRSPITEGGEHPGVADRLMYRYVDGVKRIIAQDPKALRTFVEVSHLLKPSSAMLQPGMIWSVLRQSGKKREASK